MEQKEKKTKRKEDKKAFSMSSFKTIRVISINVKTQVAIFLMNISSVVSKYDN